MKQKRFVLLSIIFFLIPFCMASAKWIDVNGSIKHEKPEVKVKVSTDETTLIDIKIRGLNVEKIMHNGNIYDKLTFPGYFTSLEIGKPQLPVITELISVPDIVQVKGSVVDAKYKTYKDYRVCPFQKLVFEDQESTFIIDDAFYQEDLLYPGSVIEIGEPTIWRDVRNVCLKINPVQYNPKTGELKVYTSLTIELSYYGVSQGENLYSSKKKISKSWDKVYKNRILNYEFLNLGSGLQKASPSSVYAANDYDYLIICKTSFEPLANLMALIKTRQGLKAKVATLSTVGTSESNIKNYITDEYDNNHISYVLLIGDIADLTWSSTGPGDYWYSDLHGDLKPEIAIGRLSAINTSELDHIISKIISYELNPPNNTWVEKSALMAHKEDAPVEYQGCKEVIRMNASYNPAPIFSTLYGASSTYGGNNATNTDVTNAINGGIGVFNYRGHGSYNS